MAKVLQRLAREGLLASHQGTRGGYQLSRSPSNISVADVIQAVDGPLTVTACSTEEENCDQYSKCSVRDPLWKIKERILVALQTCSITELAMEGAAPRADLDFPPGSPANTRLETGKGSRNYNLESRI